MYHQNSDFLWSLEQRIIHLANTSETRKVKRDFCFLLWSTSCPEGFLGIERGGSVEKLRLVGRDNIREIKSIHIEGIKIPWTQWCVKISHNPTVLKIRWDAGNWFAFIKHDSNDLILSSTKVGEEELLQKKSLKSLFRHLLSLTWNMLTGLPYS